MIHRSLLLLCAAGVALRLLFLILVGEPELRSDEANYVYLALSWNHFGFYSDSYRYLWSPGYPFLLAIGLQGFGMGGLFAVKLLQVFASASIGLSTMLTARRLFDERAARIAGLLWIFYLPLIGFTHMLWSETLFLALWMPACYLLLSVLQEGREGRSASLIAAGLLLAGAAYLKEVPLYVAPLLALLLGVFAARFSVSEALRRASLFLLVLGAAILPWTLRNYEVYGRFVPLAISLGENAYVGLNAKYKNYDLAAFRRVDGGALDPEQIGRRWFVEIDPAERWSRAEEILNTPDRLRENARRGLGFAATHPGWLLRSRVKKLADFVAPVSFFLRHLGLGLYDGTPLALPGLRQLLVLWALGGPILILLLASPGFFLALRDTAGRWLLGSLLIYFFATSTLVSMSRFRLPVVPLLIVLGAGVLSRPGLLREVRGPRRLLPVLGGLLLLIFLWWVDLPEVAVLTVRAWGGGLG
jgi:4-amino-4-deoxy-L-arabinose transferase-like glycosyltransferase